MARRLLRPLLFHVRLPAEEGSPHSKALSLLAAGMQDHLVMVPSCPRYRDTRCTARYQGTLESQVLHQPASPCCSCSGHRYLTLRLPVDHQDGCQQALRCSKVHTKAHRGLPSNLEKENFSLCPHRGTSYGEGALRPAARPTLPCLNAGWSLSLSVATQPPGGHHKVWTCLPVYSWLV